MYGNTIGGYAHAFGSIMERIAQFWDAVPQGGQWALAGLGALLVAKKALGFLQMVLNIFILSGTNVSQRLLPFPHHRTDVLLEQLRKYGKNGTWAVVTGASDGIGKEFAIQIASKGFNVVLVSRTQSKLDALAAEIEQKYSGVKTKTLTMDYTKDDDKDYERLAQLLNGLDVGILINNVGQSHSIPVSFLDTSAEELQNIITVNCLGTLKTTKVVAPLLAQRKKGLILTMGSMAGVMPTPYLATYSGSKAFLQHWSNALATELKPQGVDVQLIVSYMVTTAMSKVRRTSLMCTSPKPFVQSTLSKLGLDGAQAFPNTQTPWWSHAVFQWVVENTLGVTSKAVAQKNLDMHADIRRRALRKAEREAKKN